ncbi:hypothetical protein Tco_0762810 [Tanacetum coccineum]
MSSYNHFGCSWYGGPFNGGNYPGCSSVGSENEFVYDPNPYSFNDTPDFFNQPPQHQYETYSCELCGDSPHYGFDCQTRTLLVYDQDPCNNQNFSNYQSLYYSPSQLQQFDCCEVYEGPHFSSNYQIRNSLVYEPNPSNNYDFPSFDQPPQYHIDNSQQFDCCEHCGGPHYASDCQTGNVFYEHAPYENHDSFGFDQPSQENNRILEEILRTLEANSPIDVKEPEGESDVYRSYEPLYTLLMGDEVISTILKRENDEFIKSSVDDLVLIPRKSEVTSVCDDLECNMPMNTPLPTTDVREEDFDINSPIGAQVVDFLMENVNVADLPRHMDNLLFDEEFEDISSLEPPELTPVIDESTLLVTLPLPCTDVLGDVIVDIDLPLGEPLDTLSTRDKEIDFNPSRDIKELEHLLADDPVPSLFNGPLGNSDSMSRSTETSDLFEELIAEIGLDDLIPIEIDDRYYDSEGDILFFKQFLNEDISYNVSPALLPTESSSLVLPPHVSKQFSLREVERLDHSSP